MKLRKHPLCILAATAGLTIAQAMPPDDIYTSSGPETSLDSMWASMGHLQSLTDVTATQITVDRFHDDDASRIWLSSIGSFGNASMRNNNPGFHYSAAGAAAGYDYAMGGNHVSGLLGLSLGQVFGHQKIKELADHPDGLIEGDRFDQHSFMGNIYGGFLAATGKRSYLITNLNLGFAATKNDCKHPDTPSWDTWTYNTSLSLTWHYQVTKSLAISPFAGINYVHADNKQKRYSNYWDDDDSSWDNRGKFDNLSLEVGLAFEHTATFANGTTWTNSISGSFCPDIIRNNPHYTFTDDWWEEDTHYIDIYNGSGYPAARQAYKAKFISRFLSSNDFSVYISYQATLRDSYISHVAALGIAQSF